MKNFALQRRTLALLAVLLPLLALFVYVALRSGPLAPIPVTVTTVENRAIVPELFGIGTVESRYTYKIGPTAAGRVKHLEVQVGDLVKAGQVLGEMDPVDLDERIRAQQASLKRSEAQLLEARTRRDFAQTQARRYEQLLAARSTSEEIAFTRQYELQVAEAALRSAQEEVHRARADHEAVRVQRRNLHLVAPVDGLVTARHIEPGTTVVAGQPVVEVIDPENLWVNVRFDQTHAYGLAGDLPARIELRSQAGVSRTGRVLRVEPLADAVTEEMLAKVVFDERPEPLPPVGELTEVTVTLPALPSGPVIPNAAIQRLNGQAGVWQIDDGEPTFSVVELGTIDLDGLTQVKQGLKAGDQVVVYSHRALSSNSRIKVVERLPGVQP
ncbi:MAG: efflux RND transporter periplasmic adaptor subunit [Desulfuromonadales bacterium]|nr:efflux RND transporter periplasmic adaptor subunit [Desulfuromonadales bacterium]